MDDFFVVIGLAALAVGLVALVKGSIPSLRIPSRRAGGLILLASVVALLIGGALAPDLVPPVRTTPSPESGFDLEVPSPTPSRALPPGVPPEAQEATVVRYVDGDSLWLEGGTLPPSAASEVRLLEVDAPEAGTAYSADASSFLRQELPIGSTVYLLADVGDRDRFGRYLRYLWKANGEFFNEKLVRQGWARAILIPPNDRFIELIRRAEAEAKAAGRGFWASASLATPSTTRPPAQRTAGTLIKPVANLEPASGCDPSYPDFRIPPSPPDLDGADIRRTFTVRQPDPHRFDGMAGQVGEPDGIGCEGYN